MKFKKLIYFLISFLLVTTMIIPGNIKVKAAPVSRVYYSVDNNYIKVGQTFNIYVNCENINDLYGASLDYKYDASLLQILDITEGDVFNKSGKQHKIFPISNSTGIVSMALSLQGDVTGFNGTGKLFVIKAKALETGTVNFKTTDDSSKLTVNGTNMCVKLANGTTGEKISGVTYETENIAISPSGEITTRFQETNSQNLYKGTWILGSASYFSGGSAKSSNVTNSSSEFAFTGTGIRWISYLTANRGKANVYIDGELISVVDTYSASRKAQKVAFEKLDLASGSHKIKIVVAGTRNSAATDNYITVDAFEVVKMPTTTKLQETNSNNVYTGNWILGSASYFSGGSAKSSNVTNSSSEFTFTGTGIKWISYLTANRGKANVYIDGKLVSTVDTYSASPKAQKVAFEKLDLSSGSHKIKIVVAGTRNSAATDNYITVDAFDVLN